LTNFIQMEKQIILTADGSHTISIPDLHVTYHSVHGAIQESLHVYINAGLLHAAASHPADRLSILEMGFGTGLNALLTLRETMRSGLSVYYQSIEASPLSINEITGLNYANLLEDQTLQSNLLGLHKCEWGTDILFETSFVLHKSHTALEGFNTDSLFNVIYYDAFAPSAQPELWTEPVFRKLYHLLKPGGILVTYCSKGIVGRAMQSAGFRVEHLPGPPRKREMLRANKPL